MTDTVSALYAYRRFCATNSSAGRAHLHAPARSRPALAGRSLRGGYRSDSMSERRSDCKRPSHPLAPCHRTAGSSFCRKR